MFDFYIQFLNNRKQSYKNLRNIDFCNIFKCIELYVENILDDVITSIFKHIHVEIHLLIFKQ